MDLYELENLANAGKIDTVLVCMIDMQGRLMGKRLHVSHFLKSGHKETHCCNYLLATDFEMETVGGYKSTGWNAGYGDLTMIPDMATLKPVPWLEKTALVLCDVVDHHTHKDIAHSPRAILKKQLKRLDAMEFICNTATEPEFFLFDQTYGDAYAGHYHALKPISPYNEDYHIFQTTREEDVMRNIRNGLYGAGIPVEGSKGEASAGQEEINVHYADALTTADNHVIIKNACKEIAWQQGKAITFMAKWSDTSAGNSSHIHQSLWSKNEGKAVFFDPDSPSGMSDTMKHYLAGLIHHASAITYFLAPYTNSYKRFQAGTFAPVNAVWSKDNRTAGYRICGLGTRAIRIECRIGGADLNPYLAMATQIAAGLDGIENKRPLDPEFSGNAYDKQSAHEFPKNLDAAAEAMHGSTMLTRALGQTVVDHYYRAARWEIEEGARHVTDWELKRGFERT